MSVRKSNTRPTYILQAARLRYKDRASTPAWAEARAWISRSESCRAGFALETFEVLVLRRSDAERGLGYLGVENRELLVLLELRDFSTRRSVRRGPRSIQSALAFERFGLGAGDG